MKAIIQDRYGSPDVLRLAEIDPPVPRADEVLVRVAAASVNASDWHSMRGDPYVGRLLAPEHTLFHGPRQPVRGRDFAGDVAGVGAEVTDLAVGDEVYGDLGAAEGGFAEYVRAPARLVARKPANLTFEQSAAMPLAACTALVGVRDHGRVGPGTRLLVNGASGGVGPFAVQIGKLLGATVTAVCRTRNVEMVRALGADEVIDYTRADFTAGHPRYDVVLDLVGNRTLGDMRRALTPDGTLVLGGFGVSRGGSVLGPMSLLVRAQIAARFVAHRIVLLQAPGGRAVLDTLRDWAEEGLIRPVVDRTYPLKDVPEAIRYLETEHARAKVVITF
ncbi:NAD(P)-dependent alcohol dehydrogenase [Actinoplanes sp. NPDC051470]|uniref:NAD(P)-dependent alcohol dehydrogenase n=1 Tax=Actinoplanes sp. NPDC051470 TaxID=3157224 RepID=UPI0034263C1D